MKEFLYNLLVMIAIIATYIAGAHTLVTLFGWLYPLGDKDGIVAVSYLITLIGLIIAAAAAND